MKNIIYIILIIVISMTTNKVKSQDTLNSKSNNTFNMIRFILSSSIAGTVEGISKNDSFNIYPNSTPNSPVIIFYYGGKYHIGNKSQYKYIAKRLVNLGYTIVITQQLKYSDYQFKNIVDKELSILHSIKKILHLYNGDSSNISVMGHSSGGHIAAYIYNKDITIKHCILIDSYGLALDKYYTNKYINKVNNKVRPVFNDNICNHLPYDISLINERKDYIIFLGENTYKKDYSISYMNIYFNENINSKLYIVKNTAHLSIITSLFINNSPIYTKIKKEIY